MVADGIIAVGNGALRDLGYSRRIGDFAAHQLSTLTLLVFFGFYIRYVIGRWKPASPKAALGIGMYWLILTLVFEFGLGLASARSFSVLLAEYNIVDGHLWILVPLWVLVAPSLFYDHATRNPIQ